MTKILAFAGKKKSGKNTLCNFLHGYHLKSFNIIDGFELTENGELIIDTLVSNDKGETKQGKGIIDVVRSDIDFAIWAMDNMWPFVKHYAFATPLKEILVGLFNVPKQSVYGNDEEKNAPTQYKWEDMPSKVKGKSGYMSGRELLQYFGTDVCRKIYSNIWVDRLINDVVAENPLYSVISDARFENEIKAIQDAGGKVIKLTRNIDSSDNHQSETELDNFDRYDAIIDNQNMTIHESCQTLIAILDDWGWIAKEIIIPEINESPSKRTRFTNIK